MPRHIAKIIIKNDLTGDDSVYGEYDFFVGYPNYNGGVGWQMHGEVGSVPEYDDTGIFDYLRSPLKTSKEELGYLTEGEINCYFYLD